MYIGFCVCVKAPLIQPKLSIILSFLEYLVVNSVSVHTVNNYFSALKAMFVIYNIPSVVLDHQQIKYYIKAIKIPRLVSVPHRNVMDICTLQHLIRLVRDLKHGSTYKALFLWFLPVVRLGTSFTQRV